MASYCKEVREALLHLVCMGLFTTNYVMSQVFQWYTVNVSVTIIHYYETAYT